MDLSALTVNTPLPLLGPHLPTLIIATFTFYGAQIATHRIAPRWSAKWAEFDDRTKRSFASHVVSMVHALIAIPLALQALQSRILRDDPVFGYDPMVGHVLAISSGYFLWDTLDSLLNSTIGFVVHGAACLAVYMFSFRPFLAGFGPPFLLWELSTPLLNVHWFMDKLGYSLQYPTIFLINALWFMLVFFLARIVYGGYNSIMFFQTMWRERDRIPLHLHLIYCSGNLALNALNWLWFSKMFSKMIARLSGDDEPKDGKKRKHRSKRRSLEKGNRGEKEPLIPSPVVEEGDESPEETLALPAKPPSPIAEKRQDL